MKRTSLYEGRVDLSMDSRHIYRAKIDGGKSQHVPNVTTIIGMKDKSRGLMKWQRDCIGKAFRMTFPVGVTFKMDELQIAKVEETITKAADIVRDEAADIGTMAHDYAETRLKGEPIDLPSNIQARNACEAFDAWLAGNDIEPLYLERQLYSIRHNFCGTVDFIGRINGVLTLADFKTSKALYNDNFLQASAYKEAVEEELGMEIEQRAIIRFDKETGDFEYHVLPDTHERDFAAFQALKTIYVFDKESYKDIRAMKDAA